MKNDIVVSVCMITYNHEQYIAEAIEGVLMQKTNFQIELIIGEDCSTDKTREICIAYQQKYPEIIRLQLPEKNRGMHHNSIKVLQAVQGKHIALCEGDDFWTDPLKLQKQVDILEQDTDERLIGVVTNSAICNQYGEIFKENRNVVPNNKQGAYTLHDFLKDAHLYPTLTLLWRNKNKEQVLKKMEKLKNPFLGDWTLEVILLTMGNFYYLDEVTAVYRKNPTSITHTANAIKRWEADFVIRKMLIDMLDKQYHKYLTNNWHAYFQLAMAYRKKKDYYRFMLYMMRSFVSQPYKFFKKITSKGLKRIRCFQ